MMYGTFYRKFLFPFYETFLMRRGTLKYLEELERTQWLSEEEIREIQWAKLQRLLQHAYLHVPYYRQKFHEIGAEPQDIKSMEDFQNFPFLTKEDVQDHQEELIADGYKIEEMCQNETSGSTGRPLIFFYPRDSYERRFAVKIRSESWVGLKPGDRTLMLWGRYLSHGSLQRLKQSLYWKVQNVKHICGYQLDERSLRKIIGKINRFKPKFIVSYVTPIYYLAKLAMEDGIPLYSPQGIIVSAEKLYPYQKALIEECFQTKVYNRYGCCEFMNIAAECSEREGMHINMDTLVVEFVKPEGSSLYGDFGEVVVTDLHNYGMPFIRYRLGDIARPLNHKCPCGRGLPLMDVVQGRINEVIVTPDGRYVPDHMFLYVFAETKGVRRYQIIQKTEEALTIKLVPDSSYSPAEEQRMLKMIRSVLGDRIELKIDYVDDIPLDKTGKFKYTISEVAKCRIGKSTC